MRTRIKAHHNLMVKFSTKLVASLKRPVFLYLTTLSFTFIGAFSLIFHWAENGVNPNIHEYFDSLYYAVTVTTGVGLGDIVPVTKFGRVLSMVMMFVSTGLYVAFTGLLTALILDIELDHLRSSDEDRNE